MTERITHAKIWFTGAGRWLCNPVRVRRRARTENANHQRGFSLLELIASLAIVSLVSAALFQSMAAWMRLSARAGAAADETLTSIAGQQMFDRAVGGMTFAWPEETNAQFIGAADGFSGLSRSPLQGLFPQLSVIQFSVRSPRPGEKGGIIYTSGAADWTLQEFDGRATLSYLGEDGVWRPSWPPASNPEPGPFADADYYAIPKLPAAIRLSYLNDGAENVWIADISGKPRVPQRLQDLQDLE